MYQCWVKSYAGSNLKFAVCYVTILLVNASPVRNGMLSLLQSYRIRNHGDLFATQVSFQLESYVEARPPC